MTRAGVTLATLAILAAVAALGTACGADKPSDPSSPFSSPSGPSSSADSPAWRVLPGSLARCGPQPGRVADAPLRPTTLRDPQVGRIPAVRIGTGRVGVVLLHQTNGGGLCGWLPFMPALADAGISALAIDLCRYGESQCRKVADRTFTARDQTDAVAVAVRHLRRSLKAERVVVVGASMGGSVALMSGASLSGVDAVVDVSGPVDWPGIEVVRKGRALEVPALVAIAATEGEAEVDGSRAIVDNAPEGSELLEATDGHGYELLADSEGRALDLGTRVVDWILGR